MTKLAAVVTTIQAPTPSATALASRLAALDASFIVVGDGKGPASYPIEGTQFLSLRAQLDGPFELARLLPVGHYTRKNVGYLQAIAAGAGCIYETDDDNAPMADWAPREEWTPAARVLQSAGWVNVYRNFSQERIWPRGFPLDELRTSMVAPAALAAPELARAPIQQGLANGSPDVDAVWRLVLDHHFDFDSGPSVLLPPGCWCPFNSQSTWWWPDAYPLLYLPSYCSFRMTDIWRSFIAQRCLWAMGMALVFHGPEVLQERNEHDLMRDFADEVPGYLNNRRIAQALGALTLPAGVENAAPNLLRCYEALVAEGMFPESELALVRAWNANFES